MSTVWLLHLIADAAEVRAVVAECARVLRPGGVYVTTVDKAAAHDVGGDIDAVLAERPRRPAPDAAVAVTAHAALSGLTPAGQAAFHGHGQGRSPRSAIARVPPRGGRGRPGRSGPGRPVPPPARTRRCAAAPGAVRLRERIARTVAELAAGYGGSAADGTG